MLKVDWKFFPGPGQATRLMAEKKCRDLAVGRKKPVVDRVEFVGKDFAARPGPRPRGDGIISPNDVRPWLTFRRCEIQVRRFSTEAIIARGISIQQMGVSIVALRQPILRGQDRQIGDLCIERIIIDFRSPPRQESP